MKIRSLSYLLGILIILPSALFSDEEDRDRGGIEEITVTAEKRTSTVSDTSMSITAFDSSSEDRVDGSITRKPKRKDKDLIFMFLP